MILFSKGHKRGEFYKGVRNFETFAAWLKPRLDKKVSDLELREDEETVKLDKDKARLMADIGDPEVLKEKQLRELLEKNRNQKGKKGKRSL
jgi:hypothetical protein